MLVATTGPKPFDHTNVYAGPVVNHYFGKFRGLVSDVADPLQRGRVRVAVPALGDSVTDWAEPCLPLTGDGVYVVPPVGSHVWIEFEQGEVSRPILGGRFWDGAAL
jgi:hypothetical protein